MENDEMENDEMEPIVLVGEDGEEYKFDLVDVLELDDQKYAFLLPEEKYEDFEEDKVIILKIEEDETGEEFLVDIESDEEWDKVAEAWEKLIEEEDSE